MKNKVRKYIKELDTVIMKEPNDVRLVATISTRLENIDSRKELKHFISTLKTFRDISTYTASDYKFYDRVIDRLTTIVKKS